MPTAARSRESPGMEPGSPGERIGRAAEALGHDASLPEGWGEAFKTGGIPSSDPSGFPSKDELLSTLESLHDRVTTAVKAADAATLTTPHPHEATRKYFPTIGDMVVFLMTSHEMDHLGQLAAWRRAMGLGPAKS